MPSSKPASSPDVLTALSEDNQRLRKKNMMLLSELTHMKSLYNDIIFFIQNHVKSTLPYNVVVDQSSTASNGGANNIPKLIELGDADSFQLAPTNIISNVTGSVKTGTATTRSCGPEAITEEAKSNSGSTSTSVKLFGVSLIGTKRLHPETIDDDQHQRDWKLVDTTVCWLSNNI